ncbi:MAG: Mg2+/Co2+ transporter CorB, partial [Flavobacteriaceae bacterium]
FENFPPQGAAFTFNGHPMTILTVEDNMVQTVRIEPAPVDGAVDETSGHKETANN